MSVSDDLDSRMNDEIEILLAAHNGDRFLTQLLDSVINQTHANWKMLVSDDSSQDRTTQIIEDFASKDPRITLLQGKGPYGSAKLNFYHLLECSQAPYVAFCDQDDVWLPSKLEMCLNRMWEEEKARGSSSPMAVFSDLKVTDELGDIVSPSFVRYQGLDASRTELHNLLLQNVAPGCSMLINRSLAQLMLRSCDRSRIYMHDWIAMLLARVAGSIVYIEQPLIEYRQHSDNSVGASSYSLALAGKWLGKIDDMTQYYVLLQHQADELLCSYGDLMSKSQKQIIEAFAHLGSRCRASRVLDLIRYRLWKNKPMLVAGQLLCTMLEKRSSSF